MSGRGGQLPLHEQQFKGQLAPDDEPTVKADADKTRFSTSLAAVDQHEIWA